MLAGALADRSDRKRMMLLADLGRAGLTALIPLSVMLGGPTMAVILLVAAPMSILRAFFLAGYTASVPALVGRSQVGRANSYFEAIYSVGFILGPAIAGILATTIGPGPTLAIDALSFALSGLGLLLVRRDLRAPIDRQREPLLTEIREGIDFILGHRTLRVVILFWGLVSITIASLVSALAVHITIDLGLPASVLGIILTAFGGGTITGALLMSRVGHQRPAPFMLGGTVVTGTMLLVISTGAPLPVLMAAAFGFGVGQSVVMLTYITFRTNLSPDELLGRIGSTARTISLGSPADRSDRRRHPHRLDERLDRPDRDGRRRDPDLRGLRVHPVHATRRRDGRLRLSVRLRRPGRPARPRRDGTRRRTRRR